MLQFCPSLQIYPSSCAGPLGYDSRKFYDLGMRRLLGIHKIISKQSATPQPHTGVFWLYSDCGTHKVGVPSWPLPMCLGLSAPASVHIKTGIACCMWPAVQKQNRQVGEPFEICIVYIYMCIYNSASIPSISVTCYIDLVCAGSSFHKHNLGPHTQTRSHGILFCNKCHPPFDSWPPRPEAIRTAAIADLASNLEALKKGRQELEVGPPNVLTIWCLSGFNLSNIYPTCDVSQGNDPFLPK